MKNGLSLLVFSHLCCSNLIVNSTCSKNTKFQSLVTKILNTELRKEDPWTAKTWESDKLFMRKYFALQRNGESSFAFGTDVTFFQTEPSPATPCFDIWKLSRLGRPTFCNYLRWILIGNWRFSTVPARAHHYLLNCKNCSFVEWGKMRIAAGGDEVRVYPAPLEKGDPASPKFIFFSQDYRVI